MFKRQTCFGCFAFRYHRCLLGFAVRPINKLCTNFTCETNCPHPQNKEALKKAKIQLVNTNKYNHNYYKK